MKNDDHRFILKAIEVAKEGIIQGKGGPFGAVVVKDGKIISTACNMIYANNDPTAHAEVMAIREACKSLKVHDLEGCILYASCEPCPMCFGAIHYAGISRVVFAARHRDAAALSGFGVEKLYDQLSKGPMHREVEHEQMERERGLEPFYLWEQRKHK